MKIKSYVIMTIVTVLSAGALYTYDASAIQFEGQEDKYIQLCSSKNLSKSKQKTCKQFNTYLKKKNQSLKQSISETKSDISDTKDDIDEVQKKLTNLQSEISNVETQISKLRKSIKAVQNTIKKKEEQLSDRIYAMQSQYNSHIYTSYILDSDGLSDLFSRISAIREITSADKEDIAELNVQKDILKQQEDSLNLQKKSLKAKKNQAKTLEKKLSTLLKKQNSELTASQNESKEVSAAQKKIDENLTRLYEESLKEQSSTSVGQITSDGTTGVKVANKALSKQGHRYWWGASGPSYFDCSGLVYWAHNAAGVKIGRTTAAGYSRSGKSVSYNQLQAGDVITFSYGGGVAHIGIYIGNGQMVHASGRGSSTHGQDPNQCVKVTSIRPGSYFYKYIYNCRRLY